MGLDGVEMILAIEDQFAITVDEADQGAIKTVGDMERLIRRKLPPSTSNACLTSFTFYRLRAVMMTQFGVERRRIRPDTPLDELVPKEARRRLWSELSQTVGWRLPTLERHPCFEKAIEIAVGLGVLCLPVGLILSFFKKTHVSFFCLLGVAALPLAWLARRATTPFAVFFPPSCTTAGQATEAILALNFGKIAKDRQSWSDAELWKVLSAIVVERLGVKPEQVTRDARFVKDLKMD